jgi:ATP synthase protein I
MASPTTPAADSGKPAPGDPWHAFGYLVSGVFLYGALGWFLDRWLGTSLLVLVGILVGAGLGLYLTWRRFRPAADDDQR